MALILRLYACRLLVRGLSATAEEFKSQHRQIFATFGMNHIAAALQNKITAF